MKSDFLSVAFSCGRGQGLWFDVLIKVFSCGVTDQDVGVEFFIHLLESGGNIDRFADHGIGQSVDASDICCQNLPGMDADSVF